MFINSVKAAEAVAVGAVVAKAEAVAVEAVVEVEVVKVAVEVKVVKVVDRVTLEGGPQDIHPVEHLKVHVGEVGLITHPVSP